MSKILVLIGRSDPQAPCVVVSVDTRNGEVTTLGDTAALRSPPDGPVVLVLPGSDAQVRRLAITAHTSAQARGAAPFLFEGVVADQTDGLHFAVGDAQNASGERLVAAISTSRLQAWLDACTQLGVEPDAVYLDCTIWPALPASVDIVELEGRCIVSAGALGGYTIEPGLASALFRQWLMQVGSVSGVRIGVQQVESWGLVLAGAGAVQPLNDPLPLHTLARGAADAPAYAPDLRQGAFTTETRNTSGWKFSRFVAASLLILFCLQVGALGLAGYRDGKATADTIALATRDLRAARPELKRIVNLRAQVAAVRNTIEQSSNNPVLSVNAALIATLTAHPQAQLDEVRYAGPGRKVALRFSAPDSRSLDALAAALKARDLKVEARVTQPVEGRYSAELVVDAP